MAKRSEHFRASFIHYKVRNEEKFKYLNVFKRVSSSVCPSFLRKWGNIFVEQIRRFGRRYYFRWGEAFDWLLINFLQAAIEGFIFAYWLRFLFGIEMDLFGVLALGVAVSHCLSLLERIAKKVFVEDGSDNDVHGKKK